MISTLTRRAKETALLNALRWNNKMNKEPGCGMMSRHGIRQQIRLMQILFSLRWNVELILQSRTLPWCSTSSMKYSEEEPPCNAEDKLARRTRRH